MNKILSIFLIVWICSVSVALATDVVTTTGPGGWTRDGNNVRVQNPDQDTVVIDSLNISEESNWQTVVGAVSGIYGIHTHDYGATACEVTKRTLSTVSVNDCTIHLNDGTEYDFNQAAFPSFTSVDIPFSSTFWGINENGLVAQDTFFTTDQLKTTITLARTQQTPTDVTIIDLRSIVSEVDRRDFIYKREGIGAVVTLEGGLVATETGTRNLDLSEGDFLDEENNLHELPAFQSLSGLILYRTTAALDSWTTVGGGRTLLQVDNINYNDITSGGLVPAQNNNKYLSHTLWMSEAGGVVEGVDTGRDPTFFLFYGTNEYDSQALARQAPLDIGSFGNSKPRLMPLSRLILRKNQTSIEGFFDIRPFIARLAGTPRAIQSTASLQTVYDNSPNGTLPEIKTNDIQEDLTILYEGTNGKIFELQKSELTPAFTVWTSRIDSPVPGYFEEVPVRPTYSIISSATYTLSEVNEVIECYTNDNDVTLTLTTAAGFAGYGPCVKKTAAANTCFMDGAGAETVEGFAIYSGLNTNGEAQCFKSSGTYYKIFGSF